MKADLIEELIRQCPELEELIGVIRRDNRDYWVVGGCLRDLAMECALSDIDLAGVEDPTELAKSWSRRVGGRWFWLDEERLQSRVLLKSGTHVDFSPLRADTIEEDLHLRDFTINAMALSCLEPAELLDPFNGCDDIRDGCLRPTSERSFTDDPLRMLKGIRHAVTLDMACSPETVAEIATHSALIKKVSGERVRDELMRILTSDESVSGLDLLWKSRLLFELFNLATDQSEDSWLVLLDGLAETCQKLKGFEHEWHKTKHDVTEQIDFRILQALFLLVQVCQLLQPQDLAETLHSCLRLSRYEQRLIESLISVTGEYGQYLAEFNSTTFERTRALVVEQLEPYSLEKLLYISLFDERLSVSQSIDLHRCFSAWQTLGRVPDLISGDKIQQMIGSPSGVSIGDWHKKMKQAEINGEIANVDDAEEWLKKQMSSHL